MRNSFSTAVQNLLLVKLAKFARIASFAFLACSAQLMPCTAFAQSGGVRLTGSFSAPAASPTDGDVRGTFTCLGQPTCTGIADITKRGGGCSNSIDFSATVVFTGVNVSQPGTFPGTFTLDGNFGVTTISNGVCTYSLKSTAEVLTYTARWDGSIGSLTFSGVEQSNARPFQFLGSFTANVSTGVTQFDGTYMGQESGNARFTLTASNGAIFGTTTTGPGSGSNLPGTFSGTVSQSGAVTMSGTTGNGCTTGPFTFTGQVIVTSSTGATMTGTWSSPPFPAVPPCSMTATGGASGTWTATRISAPAFPMVVSGSIDANVANVFAVIEYRPQDVGTVGSVFVFALAPRSIITGAPAAKDGAASCVLAQLNPSGQLISASASTLVAYTSGVLSAQGQAVTILNNVPTPQVAGATFFVGYGPNASTMLATGVNRSAVSVPGMAQCPDSIAAAPGALSGLWWNSGESGWGIYFTQRRNIIFAAWYTYDGGGNPKWYVAASCAMPSGTTGTSGTCSGSLYEVNGPAFFGTTFNPALVNVVNAGTVQIAFQNANSALLTYNVGGQTRTVAITRQVFQTGTTAPAVDYTDLWWNPDESGWGMAVTHQYGILFLAWYVYTNTGKPMWYVASNCAANGNGCSGTLYRTTGPVFGPTFDSSRIQVFNAGTVNVLFTDANNGTLTYTVDGVTSSKAITRQIF